MDISALNCENPIFLLQNKFGVRLKTMELQYHRTFRSAEHLQGEATSIAMTWPTVTLPDKKLASWFGVMFFSYLRLREKVVAFNIDDPVPAHCTEYGATNIGIYTIFDAAKHDPGSLPPSSQKIDVVTDGNNVLTKRCSDKEELKLKKRGLGRPKEKRSSSKKTMKKTKTVKERHCQASAELDKCQNLLTDRTEGIFGTFNMNKDRATVLHLAKMLNAECTNDKEHCMKEVTESRKVRICCHDCNCRLHDSFEGVYCEMCFVDAWHVRKHKCDKALFDPAHKNNAPMFKKLNLNSELAEQSWSRFNRFVAITRTMTRSHFRCFLRHYCIWRNQYTLGDYIKDINPSRSFKKFNRTEMLRKKRARRLAVLRDAKKAKGSAEHSSTKTIMKIKKR